MNNPEQNVNASIQIVDITLADLSREELYERHRLLQARFDHLAQLKADMFERQYAMRNMTIGAIPSLEKQDKALEAAVVLMQNDLNNYMRCMDSDEADLSGEPMQYCQYWYDRTERSKQNMMKVTHQWLKEWTALPNLSESLKSNAETIGRLMGELTDLHKAQVDVISQIRTACTRPWPWEK